MLNSRKVTALIAALTMVVALVLLINRGGLIAWSAFGISALLLAKVWRKPAEIDLKLSIGFALGFVLIWFGTLYYVISTYESGEVIELAIDTSKGPQTARVWIFEDQEAPLFYYDAPPELATAILDGAPLQLTRNGATSTHTPRAIKADTLPEARANQLFAAMAAKYGDRMRAADIYYVMLGRPRDRVALVTYLTETE